MKLNKFQIVLCVFFIALTIFWIILNFFINTTTGFYNYLFSFLLSLIPFLAGFLNMFFAKAWGWFKSSIGRAVFFISLGSFSWGCGEIIWSYYNFFQNISAPYPSFADIGFLLAIVFWVLGISNLFRASGASASLMKKSGKYSLVTIPIIVIILSYYLLVHVARGGDITTDFNGYLKLFFDLAYPIGDVVILSFVLVISSLSLDYLGGKYKPVIILLLLGFSLMYFADFVFSYTTTVETFYNGNLGDLLFASALFLISLGSLGFKPED